MSFLTKLLDAVRSWGRRRGGPKADRRAAVSMEQLDHRQVLSANFTGNVLIDFPATMSPGVVVLPNNPAVQHPTITDPALAPLVKVSGFDLNGLRVTYTPADDVLSVGIDQPVSMMPGQPGPVIAGDSDNNGNDGTVAAAVSALNPTFQDYPEFGGSEYMGAFLDLRGTGYADVVAGYSINDPRSPKEYQVADAVVNTSLPPTTLPDFGAALPQFTGNVYKVNSPAHPNLEFDVKDFSKLYLQETGKALTPDSVVSMGAFAGSQEDTGIGEAFFPEQSFKLSQATPPVTPPCPPVSPPIIINPHENRHVNTAHPDDIRVNILGSSGFDVSKIVPGSVTLGGAHPLFGFDRFINKDEWLDATFVFKGTDVKLPKGYTEATVSGALTDGTTFSSSVKVFNRDASFYTAGQLKGAQQRQLHRETQQNGFAFVTPQTGVQALSAKAVAPRPHAAVAVDYTPVRAATPAPVPQTVKIQRREPVVAGQATAQVSRKMQASINRMVRNTGAVDVTSAAASGQGAGVSPKVQGHINRMVRSAGAVDVTSAVASGAR